MNLSEIERDIYCFVIQVKKQSAGEPLRVIVILRSAFYPEADSGRRHMFIDSFSEGVHKEFELLRGSISPKKATEWFRDLQKDQWVFIKNPEDFKYLRRKMKEGGWSWSSFTAEEIRSMADGFGSKFVSPIESQNRAADSTVGVDAPRDVLERWQHGRNFASGLHDYEYGFGRQKYDSSLIGAMVSLLVTLFLASIAVLLYCVFIWPFQKVFNLFTRKKSTNSR